MKIALDAMGGDHAPQVPVEGACRASRIHDIDIILVGDENQIKTLLARFPHNPARISVQHASEVIRMDESPAQACRQKRDASLMVANQLVARGTAQAVISAGNSGACMAASLFHLKRLPGISRPAIAIVMPTRTGNCIVIDVGANVDCKAKHLAQFALMGASLAEVMFHKVRPSVGLLSYGEEKGKGSEVTLEAYDILATSELNFIGNIEGSDIPEGTADVVVCDGFVGNVVLKLAEGLASTIVHFLKDEFKKHPLWTLGALLSYGAYKKIKKKTDYAEYGGAPLVGVNGVSLICHGGSNPKAIESAIRVTTSFIKENLNSRIMEKISHLQAALPSSGEPVLVDE